MMKKSVEKVIRGRRAADRVLYPTKPQSSVQKVPVVGGTPISLQLAVDLRTLVFGSACIMGSAEGEWLGEQFHFHEGDTFRAFAMRASKTSTKGLLMCVQGYVLKHMLFSRKGPKAANTGDPALQLKVSVKTQEDSLIAALSDILWKAGDRQSAVLCLTQGNVYVNDCSSYQTDGCTEKIHTFELKKQEELTAYIRRYLFEFVTEEYNGLLLFLYSLALSRGFERLAEDMDGDNVTLVQKNGCIHPCMATLILTGRASHYLHNGIIYEGSEDSMAKAKTGLLTRGEIGLLEWEKQEGKKQYINVVGSRLKTPSMPVWVVRSGEFYGVLFNPNRDLTRDYHAENRFDLFFHYGTFTKMPTAVMITIDTRNTGVYEEYSSPPLENIIRTKWAGAEVNWNGVEPFM
ncbi:inactive ubiquitin carboxyl-terminal hydrolase MINDY-4B-like [Macrobrachium nipponense]|uniref:inactive ubiquitin carboxyl-terminal hydrolase MINDY-4B-like n=1 Tax=Macrobrachium nipponense TaxID=159736 RepID=UPI0030C7F8AB